MKTARIFILIVLVVLFSNPTFAQVEKSPEPRLIAKPNPALADVNCVYVNIALYPDGYFPIDSNALTVARFTQRIESILRDAGHRFLFRY
jgi:hypothetical protein